MNKAIHLSALVALALGAVPANADDDPNAATNAETARLNAEAARINAQAALTTANAAKNKAAIDALGLPNFENKTELVDKGGAIETSMLASRAVSAAATTIATEIKVADNCKSVDSPIVVLAGDETFDLNSGKTMLARFAYYTSSLTPLQPSPGPGVRFDPGMIIGLATSVAGLFGNDTKISGAELPEIDDAILANAVSGKLTACAILPSAGGGIADIASSPIVTELDALVGLRNDGARLLARMPAKPTKAQKENAERLKSAIAAFDEFYKAINTPDAEGKTPLIRAILVENVTKAKDAKLLRVTVNRSGGTITNSKNFKTFFGADPVRVSGGLIASYALVNANNGQVLAAGTVVCQTAQARLRNVQSGNWFTYDNSRNRKGPATAFCSS